MKKGPKRDRGVTAKRVAVPRIPLGLAIRMFVLGAMAVAAAGWAIYRHYTLVPAPMFRPVAATMFAPPAYGGSATADANEIPAPELQR